MTRPFPRQLTTEELQAILELNQWEDFLFDIKHIQQPPATDARFTPEGTIVNERNELRAELKRAIVSSNIQSLLRSLLEE